MNIGRVVMYVLGLVIGISVLIKLVPPAVKDLLDRPDVSEFTGLTEGLQLVPFVALAALVIGCMIGLFVEFGKDKDEWGG
jgi:hypothetical protein